MFESISQLIKQFFLIKSNYLKAVIAVFTIAVLISSGILLFIPDLYPVQYIVLGALLTISSYITMAFFISAFATRYKDGVITNVNRFYLVATATGFCMSCYMSFEFAINFIENSKGWLPSAFLIGALLSRFLILAGMLVVSLIVGLIRHRLSKR